MAIAPRAEGTWQQALVGDTAVTIPAGAATGDRMFLLASWKDWAITATASSAQGAWAEIAEVSDGTTNAGNGTGSMKAAVWYRDHSGTEGDPTIDFSSTTNLLAAAVMIVFQKDGSETWDVPAHSSSAIFAVNPFAASVVIAVPSGAVVIGLCGIRDDSATFTRATDAIKEIGGPSITWNGNYVEYPATHASTTTGNDMAADAGYRLVTTGATATIQQTGTLSAAETGIALFIVQGVTAAGGGAAPLDPMGMSGFFGI